ncbi:unnamed protein product [Musa acuminata subsp. burmannicoides]
MSPSLTIADASSAVIPAIPSAAAFLLRLSGVMTPLPGSASNRKPPHSSDTNCSASSLSAITGSKSSYSSDSVAAACFSSSIARPSKSLLMLQRWFRRRSRVQLVFFYRLLRPGCKGVGPKPDVPTASRAIRVCCPCRRGGFKWALSPKLRRRFGGFGIACAVSCERLLLGQVSCGRHA